MRSQVAGVEVVSWHRPGTGPIPVIATSGAHRWRKIVGRTLSKAWGDSLFGMSAQTAFWSALSTAPLLLALLGSVGYVAGWFGPDAVGAVQAQVMLFLNSVFSPEVVNGLLADNVHNLLHRGQADVVSVGFIISLWAGSSAMSAIIEAITIAYAQHEVRHPVAERFFALGLYLVALVSGIFVLPIAAVGPDVLVRIFPTSWQDTTAQVIAIVYYPVLALTLILLLATLYKVAPRHKHAWKRGLPGALLAAVFFLVASYFLRLYVTYVSTHGLSYGALATPIVFLLFYYFVGMAIVMGAQFNNATLEYYPPRLSRRELRKWRHLEAEEAQPCPPDGSNA